MRAVAMKLHTREQAPKEGGQEAPKRTQAVSQGARGWMIHTEYNLQHNYAMPLRGWWHTASAFDGNRSTSAGLSLVQ